MDGGAGAGRRPQTALPRLRPKNRTKYAGWFSLDWDEHPYVNSPRRSGPFKVKVRFSAPRHGMVEVVCGEGEQNGAYGAHW